VILVQIGLTETVCVGLIPAERSPLNGLGQAGSETVLGTCLVGSAELKAGGSPSPSRSSVLLPMENAVLFRTLTAGEHASEKHSKVELSRH